jgi:isopenicillin-N N-acyltransferase-like protein
MSHLDTEHAGVPDRGIRSFVSEPADAHERGRAFGETWRDEIRDTVAGYAELFALLGGVPLPLGPVGGEAHDAIARWAPQLAEEIDGIAQGAGMPTTHLAAINARTEILAGLGASHRGECSTAVFLGGVKPLAVQTWDWYQRFAGNWLLWTIRLGNGRELQTLTEFGIVGKIAVNSSGLGVHFNLLRHRADHARIGVPVHVIARRAIEESHDLETALRLVGSAAVSASTALTFVATDGRDATALTAEMHPGGPAYVLPDTDGLLVHTNHFLHPNALADDREPALGGDSFFRYELLRRRLRASRPSTAEDIVAALASHLGGAGALCVHPQPDAPLDESFATLATVVLDVEAGKIHARAGGPCA